MLRHNGLSDHLGYSDQVQQVPSIAREEAIDDEARVLDELANDEVRERVASSADTVEAVAAIYPRLDQSEAYVQSLCFVDPNHASGQTYPGFVPEPPSGS